MTESFLITQKLQIRITGATYVQYEKERKENEMISQWQKWTNDKLILMTHISYKLEIKQEKKEIGEEKEKENWNKKNQYANKHN